MKVTITAYRGVMDDGNGNIIGIADAIIEESGGEQVQAAAGNFAALPDETRFIRVATDTAIHIKVRGTGAATTNPMMPASTVEFFQAHEGQIPSTLLA